jgi:PTH2 family peptidyl-tRNA hydrolase
MTYAVKQILVVRNELGMRKGKIAAQGAHASGEFMREQLLRHLDGLPIELTAEEIEWLRGGMAKITVRTDDRDAFDDKATAARALGLKVKVITDAGHTEFNGVPTVTAMAIGPDKTDVIDQVTRHLALL